VPRRCVHPRNILFLVVLVVLSTLSLSTRLVAVAVSIAIWRSWRLALLLLSILALGRDLLGHLGLENLSLGQAAD